MLPSINVHARTLTQGVKVGITSHPAYISSTLGIDVRSTPTMKTIAPKLSLVGTKPQGGSKLGVSLSLRGHISLDGGGG